MAATDTAGTDTAGTDMAGHVEYVSVSRALVQVRRAWKRTSALSGLVLVVIEALGILALFLLVDVLYHPGMGGRLALFVLATGGVAYLVARHVVGPLALRIPDEQIALFVEERNPGFEGALVSAAEFAPRGGVSAEEDVIIRAIVDEAVRRIGEFDVRSAVDLGRLKKYGAAAAAVAGVYLVMGLAAPKSMSRHVARVLMPWQRSTEEEEAESAAPAGPAAELPPVEITLSAGETRLLRGTPFELEAALSRAPEKPVLFQFVPVTEVGDRPARTDPDRAPLTGEGGDGFGAVRRRLPMEEVEKLHTYRIVLPDVNEDMLFLVSTGAYRSGTHRITVYDPLRLKGFEVTTRFPEYLAIDDHVAERPTGDVSVPEGSTVTVRIMTNGVLETGRLTWSDGARQDMEVAGARSAAAATFEVRKDRTYDFLVRDIDGQEVTNEAPVLVHSIRDTPPSLEVVSPRIDVSTHPLGEVRFLAEARDDWALASVDLVYRRAVEVAPAGRRAKRVKLDLEPRGTGAAGGLRGDVPTGTTWGDATLRFQLEDIDPRPKPGDLITYHIEARDRKGQRAISDIYLLTITPFEVWGTWLPVPFEAGAPHGGVTHVPEPVAKYLAAAWHLDSQKEYMPRDEYEAACRKLAEKFVKEGTSLWDYVRNPPP